MKKLTKILICNEGLSDTISPLDIYNSLYRSIIMAPVNTSSRAQILCQNGRRPCRERSSRVSRSVFIVSIDDE